MTSSPVTITEDAALAEIVDLMERNNVKRLPVIRGDKIVGIVSRANLLLAVADLARDVPDPTAFATASSIPCRRTTGARSG